ncbi:MAG: ribulose-phosphate 3-epimerase [Dehalococcoidia bacterium]|nr:ribulose-phosphate 3-epimerase [Dehalococcoidia bacterium]MDH4299951.1 ribulose-phosphate 3-epimerase [Dehalococcoidia bacterium]MDH4367686.1 ribulose-phosphate 3-epimerase [Dehalococcoidia bacterium]
MIKLAPSILSADFARLGEQIDEATRAGADYVHVDVMDGHFVPNITIGAPVVASIRRVTTLPLDVHLMIEHPERYISNFVDAGADIITVHVEASPHLRATIQAIKEQGARAGVSINPPTPIGAIEEFLPHVSLILVMSVNPGFGGQPFIPETLPRIAHIRRILDDRGLSAELEVDGGINADNAPDIVKAGTNVLVAGNSIFRAQEGISGAMRKLREAAG